MINLRDNPFSDALVVVATLRDRQIEASVETLKREDDLTIALREMLRNGVDINSLSEASGVPVEKIRARVDRDLNLGEDMASLAGTR